MKKNLVLPALAGTLLAAMVLAGCATGTIDKGVFDPSVPDEQQCYLQIQNSMSVKQFDETFVNWSPEGLFTGTTLVTIPAGAHRFIGSYVVTTTNNNYTSSRTVSFSVDTEKLTSGECLPGHTYKIYQQRIWLLFITITNVKIKDITPKKVLQELEA